MVKTISQWFSTNIELIELIFYIHIDTVVKKTKPRLIF